MSEWIYDLARAVPVRLVMQQRALAWLWRTVLDQCDDSTTKRLIGEMARVQLIDWCYDARDSVVGEKWGAPSPEHLLSVAIQHVLAVEYEPGSAAQRYRFTLIDNAPPYDQAQWIEHALRGRPFSPPYSPKDPDPGSYIAAMPHRANCSGGGHCVCGPEHSREAES